MKARCNNPNNIKYSSYGGKGIRVHSRWDKFESFLSDMGERPVGTTLGRFGDLGDYEPGNCLWMTAEEQVIEAEVKSGIRR